MSYLRHFAGAGMIVLAACSSSPTDPLADLDQVEAAYSGTEAAGVVVIDPGDPNRKTYTFDELTMNCGWNVTTTGLYEDLVFPSLAYMSPCQTSNGTIGLMPSQEGILSAELRVGLPTEASAVSIESEYFWPVDGAVPTLVAYDADGNEVGRHSDGTPNAWVTLEVSGDGTPIVEIGFDMPQLRVRLDNLAVTYVSDDPDPEPDPDAGTHPIDPTEKADCRNGGWEGYGFRNQGQCVRFIETGQDSRPLEPSG